MARCLSRFISRLFTRLDLKALGFPHRLYFVALLLVLIPSLSFAVTNKNAVVYIPLESGGHGAGTIFYDGSDHIGIVTAYHNVQGYFDKQKKTVPVFFYGSSTRYEGKLYDDKANPILDLALIKVWTTNIPANIKQVSFDKASQVADGTKVIAIGHRTGGGYEKWLHDRGEINQPPGPEIKFTTNIVDKGFSGGPLLNEDGELLGIITKVNKGLGISKNVKIVKTFLEGCGYVFSKSCDEKVMDEFAVVQKKGDYDTPALMEALEQLALDLGCIGHPYSAKVQEPNDIFVVTPISEYENSEGSPCREYKTYLNLKTEGVERKYTSCKKSDGFWYNIESPVPDPAVNIAGRWTTTDNLEIWMFHQDGSIEVTNQMLGTHGIGQYHLSGNTVTGTISLDQLAFIPTSGTVNFSATLNAERTVLSGEMNNSNLLYLLRQQ